MCLSTYVCVKYTTHPGHTNPMRQGARVNKSLKEVSIFCGSSVQNFLFATCLVPRILRWHLEVWKMFCTLQYAQLNSRIFEVSTSGMGIDILRFGLERNCSGREHDISVTARLKKLLNVVMREALVCSMFKLGIMARSLSFFICKLNTKI